MPDVSPLASDVSSLVIGIPTLNRPHRIATVSASAHESVSLDHEMRVCWLVSPGDDDAVDAILETEDEMIVVGWQPEYADWAKKLNLLYRTMSEEWLLLGADDLQFHAGWFDNCLKAQKPRGAGAPACVIGTNDLGNSRVLAGYHSTHPLVHRDYIHCGGVVDDPSLLLPEVYGHWFVDDEFVQTAQARRTYAHAHDAIVEHMHPEWGKSERDETYDFGYRSIPADRQIFEHRKRLWRGRH